MRKDQEILIEFIDKEEDEDKKDILSSYLVTKKRINEYEKFVENDDNFPINIRLKMAFEGENLAIHLKNWSKKTFWFR